MSLTGDSEIIALQHARRERSLLSTENQRLKNKINFLEANGTPLRDLADRNDLLKQELDNAKQRNRELREKLEAAKNLIRMKNSAKVTDVTNSSNSKDSKKELEELREEHHLILEHVEDLEKNLEQLDWEKEKVERELSIKIDHNAVFEKTCWELTKERDIALESHQKIRDVLQNVSDNYAECRKKLFNAENARKELEEVSLANHMEVEMRCQAFEQRFLTLLERYQVLQSLEASESEKIASLQSECQKYKERLGAIESFETQATLQSKRILELEKELEKVIDHLRNREKEAVQVFPVPRKVPGTEQTQKAIRILGKKSASTPSGKYSITKAEGKVIAVRRNEVPVQSVEPIVVDDDSQEREEREEREKSSTKKRSRSPVNRKQPDRQVKRHHTKQKCESQGSRRKGCQKILPISKFNKGDSLCKDCKKSNRKSNRKRQ